MTEDKTNPNYSKQPTVGGDAAETVTFTVGTGALTTLTIISGIGSTAACT